MIDGYFIYVKFDGISGVIRLFDGWEMVVMGGDDNVLNGIKILDDHYDIDDVMDYLREEFDYVEEIEYETIDEYI